MSIATSYLTFQSGMRSLRTVLAQDETEVVSEHKFATSIDNDNDN